MLSVKPWRAEAVAWLVAALLFCMCFGVLADGLLQHAKVEGFRHMDDFGNIFVSTISIQGAVWVLGYSFLKQHQVSVRQAFGLNNPNLGRALRMALVTFAVALPVVWVLQAACVTFLTRLGWKVDSQAAVQLLQNAKSPWTRGYLGFFAACLAPVSEEFMFRGVLYPFVKQLGWPRLAIFSVSFVFALIHFDLPTFLPLFVLALALTWLYEKTDVLLAPILVHSLFNTANLIVMIWDQFGKTASP